VKDLEQKIGQVANKIKADHPQLANLSTEGMIESWMRNDDTKTALQ